MTAIVCICDRRGMLFNKRRQSRDKAVLSDISKITENGTLFISEFSAKLFSETDISVLAVSDPLASAGDGDYAFIENMHLIPYKDKIDRLIIYKWNKKYPADFLLDIEPQKESMTLFESFDFVGNAHDKITREIWVRT